MQKSSTKIIVYDKSLPELYVPVISMPVIPLMPVFMAYVYMQFFENTQQILFKTHSEWNFIIIELILYKDIQTFYEDRLH